MILPPAFENSYRVIGFRTVDIECLYVRIWFFDISRAQYVPINKTPHYFFALSVIKGEVSHPVQSLSEYHIYKKNEYAIHNPNNYNPFAKKPEEKIVRLVNSIKANGYNWQAYPIFVSRHWKRPLPLGRWDVLDGVHRLAVLAALGESRIKVCLLGYKDPSLKRLLNRLGGIYLKKWKHGPGGV
jgi:hypothetical protein